MSSFGDYHSYKNLQSYIIFTNTLYNIIFIIISIDGGCELTKTSKCPFFTSFSNNYTYKGFLSKLTLRLSPKLNLKVERRGGLSTYENNLTRAKLQLCH